MDFHTRLAWLAQLRAFTAALRNGERPSPLSRAAFGLLPGFSGFPTRRYADLGRNRGERYVAEIDQMLAEYMGSVDDSARNPRG